MSVIERFQCTGGQCIQEEGRELDKGEGHLHTCKCIGIYTCNTITIHEGRERHLHCFVKGHKLLNFFLIFVRQIYIFT